MADELLAYRRRFPTLERGPYFAAHTLGPMPDTAPAALAATLVYGVLGAACALVLRGALAGVVALLAWGLLGELVLAPRWAPASGWTVWTSAARLTGQGTTPLPRAVLVVVLAFGLALVGCLAAYARRQVRD